MPKNLNVIAMAKTPAKIRRATRTAARAQVGDVDVMMALRFRLCRLLHQLMQVEHGRP
jgi:hypothetical protein